MVQRGFSKSVLPRLPAFFSYLKTLPPHSRFTSATAISSAIRLGVIHVRKDLATIIYIDIPQRWITK